LSAIHIDCIAEIFKRIKRDTHRQQQIQGLKSGLEQRVGQLDEKISVLEVKKQSQIEYYAQQQQAFFTKWILLSVDGIRKEIIYDGRQYYQPDKGAAGFVKKVKGEKTENVSSSRQPVAQPIVQDNEGGKEEYEEPVVEQERIFRIIEKLFPKCLYVEAGQGVLAGLGLARLIDAVYKRYSRKIAL
jgi:hypothetical protein